MANKCEIDIDDILLEPEKLKKLSVKLAEWADSENLTPPAFVYVLVYEVQAQMIALEEMMKTIFVGVKDDEKTH